MNINIEKEELLDEVKKRKKQIKKQIGKQAWKEGYKKGIKDTIQEILEEEKQKPEQETDKHKHKLKKGDKIKLTEKGRKNFKDTYQDIDLERITGEIRSKTNHGIRVHWNYLKGNSAYYHNTEELKKAKETGKIEEKANNDKEEKILKTIKEEPKEAVSVSKIMKKLNMKAENTYSKLKELEERRVLKETSIEGDKKRRFRIKW